MGYNMFILELPEKWSEDAQAQFENEPGWFRLSLRDMKLMRGIMIYAGALNLNARPKALPRLPWGMSHERLCELLAFLARGEEPSRPPTEKELAKTQKYRDAMEETSRGKTLFGNKPPAYKFSSVGGWIVSPQEADIIATKLFSLCKKAHQLPERVKDKLCIKSLHWRLWVESWARFNALAAQYGGYKVG